MENKANTTPGSGVPNPYKGLYSYEEADREKFRGREEETETLFRLVKHNFLTVVFGKSGIGKTSLLNAGLFPRLRAGEFLPVNVCLDYSSPAPDLVEQVRRRIEDELEKGFAPGETLWEYFHRVRHFGGTGGKRITPVLVFDRFEEMFSIGKDRKGTAAWKEELYYLLEDQFPASVRKRLLSGDEDLSYSGDTPDVRVIIGLREDYLPHLNSLKSRIPSIDRVMHRVVHLNGPQARKAIDIPGGIQDKKTINEMVRLFYPGEAEEDEKIPEENLEIEPSILSLLCYQLIEEGDFKLVAGRTHGKILEDFYYSVIRDVTEEACEFIESKLLTEGGTRTPYRLEPGFHLGKVIDTLVSRRILRKVYYGGKEHIEIIHDILAPVIKRSRDERKSEAKRREEFRKAEERRKKELEEAEEKRKLELEERKKKFNRVIIAIISTAAVILAILASYAYIQKDRAEEQERIAREESKNNKAYALAARSANLLSTDADVSFRLAVEAYNTVKTNPVAYNALLEAYFKRDVTPREFHPKSETSEFFAVFAPDKERLRFVTVSSEQLILWKLSDGKENKIEQKNELGLRAKTAFSPDGKYFAFLTRLDEEIGIWELDKDKIVSLKLGVGVNSVAFSPDGKKILTGNRDNTARLWDLNALIEGRKDKALVVFKWHENEVNSAVFSPKGEYVVTGGWDGTARLWSSEGEKIEKFNCSKGSSVDSAVFSPDGKLIVTADNHTKVQLWDLKGKELKVFEGHTNAVKSALFSPDGKYIVTASDDETVRLWDLDGNQVFKFEGFKVIIHTASFSPDGKYLLIAPAEGPAQLRLVNPEEIIRFADENGVPPLTGDEKKIFNIIE